MLINKGWSSSLWNVSKYSQQDLKVVSKKRLITPFILSKVSVILSSSHAGVLLSTKLVFTQLNYLPWPHQLLCDPKPSTVAEFVHVTSASEFPTWISWNKPHPTNHHLQTLLKHSQGHTHFKDLKLISQTWDRFSNVSLFWDKSLGNNSKYPERYWDLDWQSTMHVEHKRTLPFLMGSV